MAARLPELTAQDRRILAAVPASDSAAGIRDRDVLDVMKKPIVLTSEVAATLRGFEQLGFVRRWENRYRQELWTRTRVGDAAVVKDGLIANCAVPSSRV